MKAAKLKSQAVETPAPTNSPQQQPPPDADWQTWVTALFPAYVTSPFAARHVTVWDWAWTITRAARPSPLIAVWPRGGGKSTTVELICLAVGERQVRSYGWYVSATQSQADGHVATIASQFESIGTQRLINKYGSSKGWRRNRLRTAKGYTVDSLGLDVASRGIKTEENRPDFIIFDDIDDRHDSKATVERKIELLTQTILPSGSANCAILGCQNLVHSNSVFSQLVDRRADFLLDRTVSGPFKAINGIKYERREDGTVHIIAGEPTWEGQDLVVCEGNIQSWGLRAFLREAQHEVGNTPGAMWTVEIIDATRVLVAPDLVRVVVALDPAAKGDVNSDDHGIGVSGRAANGHKYVLADYSVHGVPSKAAARAICAYIIHKADRLVGEINNGGEWIGTVIKQTSIETVRQELVLMGHSPDLAIKGDEVNYGVVHATRGKEIRAEPVSTLYSEGQVHHVGNLSELEGEMTTWVPGRGKSPNRVDWLVWSITDLGSGWSWKG